MAANKLPQDEVWERQRVGATIRALRIARDKTADALANQIGVSRPYLANIEAGRKPITRELRDAIADALDVSPLAIVRPGHFPDEQAA